MTTSAENENDVCRMQIFLRLALVFFRNVQDESAYVCHMWGKQNPIYLGAKGGRRKLPYLPPLPKMRCLRCIPSYKYAGFFLRGCEKTRSDLRKSNLFLSEWRYRLRESSQFRLLIPGIEIRYASEMKTNFISRLIFASFFRLQRMTTTWKANREKFWVGVFVVKKKYNVVMSVVSKNSQSFSVKRGKKVLFSRFQESRWSQNL